MAASLDVLPLELLLFICSHLQVPDIQNTRLTCRLLDEAASPYLINRVWLSSDSRDQDLLAAISKHSIIGRHARKITYDATIYESAMIGRNGKPGKYVECGGETPRHWSKSTLQGFYHYSQQFREWEKLQRHSTRDHQTRTSARLPANFNTLVMELRDSRKVSKSKILTRLAQYLPADLICLLQALLLMPSITTFTVSDQRWVLARNRKPSNRDYTGTPRLYGRNEFPGPLTHWQTLDGKRTLIIEPRQWPRHSGGNQEVSDIHGDWYRGFFVLTQAASMLDLRNLHSFRIDSADDHGVRGITHEVFQLAPMELMHTWNAFRGLTQIVLQLNQTYHSPERLFRYSMERGNIALILGSAHNLTDLELSFTVPLARTLDTREIFGSHT